MDHNTDITVTSWNCYGLKNKKDSVSKICSNSHIMALQETLLWPHDLHISDTIHSDYNSYSTSAMEVTNNIVKGRPHGGLSFLWHKSIDKHVKILSYNCDRILGLKLMMNNVSTLLINVYLPCDNPNNFDQFCLLLGQIQSIIHDSDADHFCVLGDFNAHPSKPFFTELLEFCLNNSLTISDKMLLPPSSYTYIHHGSSSTSWLDHCLTSQLLHRNITTCMVHYNAGIFDDHLPLSITLKLPSPPLTPPPPRKPKGINWRFDNTQKSSAYTAESHTQLNRIHIPLNMLYCNNPTCRNIHHLRAMNALYEDIISALKCSGNKIFGRIKNNSHNVPGWNEYVSDLHRRAREAFLLWRNHSSPREGNIAQLMRSTRAQFKFALRECRANEAQIRAEALSQKLSSRDHPKFWKDIQSLNPKTTKTPQRVGEAVGDTDIAELWASHFSDILNCINDPRSKSEVDEMLSYVNPDTDPLDIAQPLSPSDIKNAINKLAGNKATGCDGISTEAYKYAHPILHTLLSLLYNACISHQYLPALMLIVHLIPLIKNKLKDSADPSNYRPIAITTISSKIFESLLLTRLQPFLSTTDNQFGFKANHSTEACIYVLKDILNYYLELNSPVFLCFVDARKAFDRVNYYKLFIKLRRRGTPLYLIGILNFWFKTQQFHMNWGNTISRGFGSGNGLRQGGILSPYLFNVYVDDLSLRLNTIPIGCTVNGHTINNLCYADDMVLLSPSLSGLQQLINECATFADANDILYNESKTQCMSVLPRRLRNIPDPVINLKGHRLQFVDEFPYLGQLITKNQKDTNDIERRRRNLCAIGNMITRRFAFCNLDTKLTLFRTYCYSIYGGALWADYTQESFRHLKVVHNDILRCLTHTPRYTSASALFVSHNLRSLKEIIRYASTSLINRLESSENTLIKNVLVSEAKIRSKLWIHWNETAFTAS